MNIIKINFNEQEIYCFLLAKFQFKYSYCKRKIFSKKRYKIIYTSDFTEQAIVYIPWKYSKKQIIVIGANNIVKDCDFSKQENVSVIKEINVKRNNVSKEKYFVNEYTFKDIQGYSFLCNDNRFIKCFSNFYKDNEFNNILDLLYKNLPDIEKEEVDDTFFVESIFKTNDATLSGINLCFSYYDKVKRKNPLKNIQFNKNESLFVSVLRIEHFLDLYLNYFKECESESRENQFDEFGLNFYPKEIAERIYNNVSNANIPYSKILLDWLYKSFIEHDGFYIIGY